MKYTTNDYMLITFDQTGSKLNTDPYGTYLTAKQASDEHMNDNPEHSTAILRVLYNSQDTRNKWGYNT